MTINPLLGKARWHTWASTPGRPRDAAAIEGRNLMATAETYGADAVLVDLGNPSRFFATIDQLRVLTALPPPPPWRRP